MADKLLRVPAVLELLSISRATLTRWRRAGRFPEPVKLGRKYVGWRDSDIQDWMTENRQRAA